MGRRARSHLAYNTHVLAFLAHPLPPLLAFVLPPVFHSVTAATFPPPSLMEVVVEEMGRRKARGPKPAANGQTKVIQFANPSN